MAKIYCADVGCAFNNDKGVCTAKKVALSWHSVATVWEGRQEFQRCKTRETSKERRELEKRMETLINELTGKVTARSLGLGSVEEAREALKRIYGVEREDGLAKDREDAVARLVRISQATTRSFEDVAGAVSEYVLKGRGNVEEALEALERRYGVEREDGRCGRSE